MRDELQRVMMDYADALLDGRDPDPDEYAAKLEAIARSGWRPIEEADADRLRAAQGESATD